MNTTLDDIETIEKPSLADYEKMHDYLAGYTISSAIYAAANLGVADHLGEEPVSIKHLAGVLSVHEQSLYRLMRALASVGIFKEVGQQSFVLTTLAATIRKDAANSLRNLIIMCGSSWHWQTWGGLLHTIETGEPAFVESFKTNFFPYIQKNPEVARDFNAAMTSLSSLSNYAIASSYDFSKAKCIVDIGGGQGGLLAAILKQHQNTTGILYDLPEVVASATELLEREQIKQRTDVLGGDFFQSIPEGGDLYIIKHVLHGINQEQSVILLKNIAKVLPKSGKLLIIEMMIPEKNKPSYSKFNDLEMMLLSATGRERTAHEFTEIITQCSLGIARILSMPMGVSIIECIPHV